jgi:hypothetical protein
MIRSVNRFIVLGTFLMALITPSVVALSRNICKADIL